MPHWPVRCLSVPSGAFACGPCPVCLLDADSLPPICPLFFKASTVLLCKSLQRKPGTAANIMKIQNERKYVGACRAPAPALATMWPCFLRLFAAQVCAGPPGRDDTGDYEQGHLCRESRSRRRSVCGCRCCLRTRQHTHPSPAAAGINRYAAAGAQQALGCGRHGGPRAPGAGRDGGRAPARRRVGQSADACPPLTPTRAPPCHRADKRLSGCAEKSSACCLRRLVRCLPAAAPRVSLSPLLPPLASPSSPFSHLPHDPLPPLLPCAGARD